MGKDEDASNHVEDEEGIDDLVPQRGGLAI